MKIRIQGNKLRFRLKQFEVASFRTRGEVKEVMAFGPAVHQQLHFVLLRGDDQFSLQQKGTIIELSIPAATADEWTSSDRVGFEEQITTAFEQTIVVLVEKDFECIDGKQEDNIGAYPNPRMNH